VTPGRARPPERVGWPGRSAFGRRRSWLQPVTLGLASLGVTLDTAVNAAFPAISAAFDVPVGGIQGVVLSYILPFSLALVPAGRLADRTGHLRVLRVGLAGSALAYLACGLAEHFGTLLAARAFQGLTAALVFASAPALVTLGIGEGRRGTALGAFNFVSTGGMVLGPLAGGLLVARLGWPWVFLGRVPLVLVAWILVESRVFGGDRRRVADRDAAAGPGMAATGSRVRFGPAATDWPTLVRTGLANLLANAALFAVWLLGPYYLVVDRKLGAAAGGALLAIAPFVWAAVAPLSGQLADRGFGRRLAGMGLLVEAGGLGLISTLDAESSLPAVALALALAGSGIGLFVVPNMRDLMGALGPAQQGMAGALFMLTRNLGLVLGASLWSALYGIRLAARRSGDMGAAPAAAFGDTFLAAALVALVAAALAHGRSRGDAVLDRDRAGPPACRREP
jgi:MFS family permease